jgi:predicted dehydrogenase
MKTNDVRLAFVGCGRMTSWHLEGGLGEFDDVELVGWCDVVEENARARREQSGGQGDVFSNVDRMLDETRPDAVYIVLPPSVHGPAEAAVLERELPFFVEKPVALDVATARKTLDGVRRTRVLNAVGYMTRYQRPVQHVRELLEGQTPVMLHGGWLGAGPQGFDGTWRWWVQKEQSGGQFFEQTTHTLDLARYLFGEVVSVYATGVRDRRDVPDIYTIEDASMVQLTFRSGAVGTLYSACCTPVGGGVSLSLWTTEMRVDFAEREHTATIQSADGVTKVPGDPKLFRAQNRAFVDAVKTGDHERILATYEDGYEAVRVAAAADTSMRTGEAVALDATPPPSASPPPPRSS